LSTPTLNPDGQPADAPVTTESLGWQLRAALPPLRLHSLSVYDLEGEVLWLSEGALGPDEHTVVIEALGSLGDDPSIAYREDELEDGRAAVFLAARSPRVGLAGVLMILVDSKSLSAGSLAGRVLTPQVQALLERLAVLLAGGSKESAPGAKARSAAPAPAVRALEPTTVDELLTLQVAKEAPQEDSTSSTGTGVWRALPPGATGQWAAPPGNGTATGQWPEPAAGTNGTGQWPGPAAGTNGTGQWPGPATGTNATGQWSAPPPSPSATGQWAPSSAGQTGRLPAASVATPANGSRMSAAAAGTAVEVSVQELTRLRSGSHTRRFHVLPSAVPEELGSVRTIVTTLRELIGWLGAHRQMLEHAPISLSIAIGAAALAAEELPEAIAECVQPARLRAGTLGFQIAEALCLRYRPHTERLLRKLEALGCVLVLDDFVFDSSALELLRAKILRMVKVHPGLIAGVSRDRLCQARAVAIAQAARVLGIHCSAKRVEDRATCRWLAWAGFEFVEGPLFERPLSLASLGALLAEAN